MANAKLERVHTKLTNTFEDAWMFVWISSFFKRQHNKATQEHKKSHEDSNILPALFSLVSPFHLVIPAPSHPSPEAKK